MGQSVRVYCYEPSGKLYLVPVSLASAMVKMTEGERVAIPCFANRTVRFAQFVVDLQSRRPIGITLESYYVYRFNSEGVADSERHIRETLEKIDYLSRDEVAVAVFDARGLFSARGRGWSPTSAEKVELYQAVFGEVKVPRLPKVAVDKTDVYPGSEI